MIKRKLLPEILQHLSKPEITMIVGARQVGKTTLMRQVLDTLSEQKKSVLYFNLDFESDYFYFENQAKFLQKLRLELGEKDGFVFIDEIQRRQNAGLFLKGLFDRKLPYKFIVSGSGSMELKEKMHESLTGRKRIFELSTVTVWEFFQYATNYAYESSIHVFIHLERQKADLLLNEYMSYGGYPRIVTENENREKFLLMNEIYSSYLYKDIVYLLKLDRPDVFTTFIRLMAHYCGSILNYSTLATDVGISVPTLKKYLWYAKGTFIIKTIPPFFRNKRKEIKKSPMIYFNDIGLRNFALNLFGNDIQTKSSGRLFQNLIFLILNEILHDKPADIYFWRTSDAAEVDFVVQIHDRIIPIEVKYTHLKNSSVTRSLRSFIEAYEPETALVVNLSYEGEMRIGNTNIKFICYFDLYKGII